MPHDATATAAPDPALYREMPPPPELAPFVTCLWTRTATAADPSTRVVPDGCVDLMLITELGTSHLVVAGPDTRAHSSTLAPGGTIAGVRFAPGTAAGVLGVPLHALRDDRPRFQSALALARAGYDLARVAHECGYADQSHLARDVADLADTTLTTLLDR
jgi:hypothetical protein